ncbi:MAG: hypothetical protein IJL17_14550, partial [Kiritimatiellae bacterium]|nr:hypothetical protein [Kiritimatiellia bacterium]
MPFIQYGSTKGRNGGTNNVQMVVGPGVGTLPLLGDPPVVDEWENFMPITSTNTTQTLTGDDFRRGFVLARVGTDEAHDFSPPSDATVCADWRAFGAAEDWFYVALTNWMFQIGTNEVDRLRIHSDGWVGMLGMPAHPAFWPLKTKLEIAPEANWFFPSQFWHFVTPSNTLQMTWQNVLLNGDTNTPVSVQAEVWADGRFVFRYDLSRCGALGERALPEGGGRGATALPDGTITNILVGVSVGGSGWTTNSVPTNLTSLAFHPLSADDAVNLDRDGDGITLLDELFAYGSDPDLWDTDGDGVSDGDEVASGANPLVRDQGEGLTGGTASPDFLSECGAAANRLVAWEIVPSAFSFARPPSLTNIVTRTFRVDRTSPWQQLYVSARPNGAAGWTASDVTVRYGVDGGPATNEVPSASFDSWRLPLGPGPVTNLTFVVEAAGDAPALSRPLHLLRWSPHVALETDEAGRFLDVPEGKAPVF